MNLQYTQPEADITELERKERGARLECDRLESQIFASIERLLSVLEQNTGNHADQD